MSAARSHPDRSAAQAEGSAQQSHENSADATADRARAPRGSNSPGGVRRWLAGVLPSLRLRLVVVFALVALTAAVSASGIAYWLNRDAVLTRAQNAALNDFRKSLEDNVGNLPREVACEQLRDATDKMAGSTQNYEVLLIGETDRGTPCAAASNEDDFTLGQVPGTLRKAVDRRRALDATNRHPYHLYWQRITIEGDPYLVGGAKVIGDEPTPTGYMLKSLAPERDDLSSLAWSLGIATGLALLGAMLLAQAAATTVLRPVRRLAQAAKQLGEGRLDTRLKATGTDELAELSRTFNRSAEALEARVAELSAREESSRRFVADMSHELRTPMTAISAVTEVLEEEQENLDPMIAPAVQLVVSETRRLNDLVENLMEVTRFDAGTAKLVLDDVDVADQVTACIDARAWLDAVELDADRGIMARLDPRRLDVILANLIGNALKHGGSPVRVSVHTEPPQPGDLTAAGAATRREGPQRELVIQVADRGPGIPEEVLPHVFDRFYKASASRPRSDGSGLGLSIAMENAHIHGGWLTAHNSREGGAVFTLRLPRDAGPFTGIDDTADDGDGGDDGGSGENGTNGNGRGRNGEGRSRRGEQARRVGSRGNAAPHSSHDESPAAGSTDTSTGQREAPTEGRRRRRWRRSGSAESPEAGSAATGGTTAAAESTTSTGAAAPTASEHPETDEQAAQDPQQDGPAPESGDEDEGGRQ